MNFELVIDLLERATLYNDQEPLRLAINHIEHCELEYPPLIQADIHSALEDLYSTGIAELDGIVERLTVINNYIQDKDES